MLTLRIEHFGSLSKLHLQELPKPSLQPNEVLVEIHAAAINPSDVKNVLGAMHQTTLPRTPGRDFAGVIIEGAANLIGTEVWGSGGDLGFTRDGTHAQYLVLPVDAVQPKPKTLSMENASTIGTSYITAWMGLMEAAQIKTGETVLIIGATGAVGSAAIQIAKWKGAFVIGTVRSETDKERVTTLGVDRAIDLKNEDLQETILAVTEEKGVDVAYDTVGGSMFEICLRSLANRGRLIEISSPLDKRQVCFDLLDFYRRELRIFGVNSLSANAQTCAQILAQLSPGFESNFLRSPDIANSYKLEEAVRAYEQVHNRSVTGKIILKPNSP
jgi:NADPH:quinone reductase